jgi:predicted nuclease with TOPRIM domain
MAEHPMSEQAPEMLVYLRRIDAKVDRLVEDMREVKERLSILEEQQALSARTYASLSSRLDRIEIRLDRIERRLDLVES